MKSVRWLLIAFVVVLCMNSVTYAQDEADANEPKWTGQVSAGWTSSRGNSSTDTLTASASTERRSEKDRISAGADYGNSRQKDTTTNQKSTTEDWWRVLGQYDYYFAPKWFGFVNGRYESDRIAKLDSRAIIGLGAGYQVVESEPITFSVEGGLAYKSEEFTNNSPSKNDLTAQLGYKLNWQIVETVQFINDLSYFPVIDDWADYLVTTTAELRGNFTENLFSNFRIIYSRNATPAQGQANSDIKYILGIGWNF
ncbi:YdiY family protein [Planctomycetota bacterium]